MARLFTHLTSPQSAKSWCEAERKNLKTIGFVATMGALHAGHASLVERSKSENDTTIVSIFINPLQFNHQEDLTNYPRDLMQDISFLKNVQVDALFTGTPQAFLGQSFGVPADELPDPGIYAKGMEGTFRPGHFAGVREIVSRLFGFVGPCRAYFGEKDYQQGKVIEQLAEQMRGINVVLCPTLRANNGLALSSRNQRLSKEGLRQSIIIYQAMQATKIAWKQGEQDPKILQNLMHKRLDKNYFQLEYAETRDSEYWTTDQPIKLNNLARVFVAGKIEGIRLIDTLCLSE